MPGFVKYYEGASVAWVKVNIISQSLKYLSDEEHFIDTEAQQSLRGSIFQILAPRWIDSIDNWGVMNEKWNGGQLLKGECVFMRERAHDRREKKRQREGAGKTASVYNAQLRFGNGRFASSTPISLLWHSSPLNRIDYWFFSLHRLWDFPSDSLCSKRSAEEKHKSLCVRTHNDTSLIQTGRATWKSLSLKQYPSQGVEGCRGAHVKITSKSLMWSNENESRLIAKIHTLFFCDLWKSTTWQMRQGQKLPVHHHTWILEDDITPPGARDWSLRSEEELIDFSCLSPFVFMSVYILSSYALKSSATEAKLLLCSVKSIIFQTCSWSNMCIQYVFTVKSFTTTWMLNLKFL